MALKCITDSEVLYLAPCTLKYGLLVSETHFIRIESFTSDSIAILKEGLSNLREAASGLPDTAVRIILTAVSDKCIKILDNYFANSKIVIQSLLDVPEVVDLVCINPIQDWSAMPFEDLLFLKNGSSILMFPCPRTEQFIIPNHLVKVLSQHMQMLARFNQVLLSKCGRKSSDLEFPFTSIRGFSGTVESPLVIPEGQHPSLIAAATYLSIRETNKCMFVTPMSDQYVPQPAYSPLTVEKFLTNNHTVFQNKILKNLNSGGFRLVEVLRRPQNNPFFRVSVRTYAGLRVDVTSYAIHYAALTAHAGAKWLLVFPWYDIVNHQFLPLTWEEALAHCA